MPYTDTEMLDWLIKMGYTPAVWRPARPGETCGNSGQVLVSYGSRERIAEVMNAQKERQAKETTA